MTRGAAVESFAAKHRVPMLTIEALMAFRETLAAAHEPERCASEA